MAINQDLNSMTPDQLRALATQLTQENADLKQENANIQFRANSDQKHADWNAIEDKPAHSAQFKDCPFTGAKGVWHEVQVPSGDWFGYNDQTPGDNVILSEDYAGLRREYEKAPERVQQAVSMNGGPSGAVGGTATAIVG